MKIIINGATGHMGQKLMEAVARSEHEAAALVDPKLVADPSLSMYSSIADFDGDADVIIDFSHHSAAIQLLEYAKSRKIPVVLATTGQTDEEKKAIYDAGGEIPIFFAANMSLGVAVTIKLAKAAAAAFPGADIEIVETHHNRKLDAPSGTALSIFEAIKGVRGDAVPVFGREGQKKREKNEIGVHSLRMGNIVGIHEILISTGSETITIKHEAHDRALFADGALAAAEFLVTRGAAGIYTMEDLTS
ncbi:MAG: 4-hydroxy-tetrahydrodipicolinate reductase [Firmicutes bacterium]|nr:4-hydroxy-tetrahydrodipicolinate reductase [Bacillota bacterium]